MPPSIDSESLRLRLLSVQDVVRRKLMPPDCDPGLMRQSLQRMEELLNKGQLPQLQQRLQRMESLLHYDENPSPTEPSDKDSLSSRLKRANDWVERKGTPPDCDAISIRRYLQQSKDLLDSGDYRTLQIKLQRLETLVQIRPSQGEQPQVKPDTPSIEKPPPATGEEESLRLRLQSVQDVVRLKLMPPDCDPALMRQSLRTMEELLNKGQLPQLQQRLQRMESLLHYDENASPSEPSDKDSLSVRLKRANDWVERRRTPPDCDAISIRRYLQQSKDLLDIGDYRTLQIKLQRLETLLQIRPSPVKTEN